MKSSPSAIEAVGHEVRPRHDQPGPAGEVGAWARSQASRKPSSAPGPAGEDRRDDLARRVVRRQVLEQGPFGAGARKGAGRPPRGRRARRGRRATGPGADRLRVARAGKGGFRRVRYGPQVVSCPGSSGAGGAAGASSGEKTSGSSGLASLASFRLPLFFLFLQAFQLFGPLFAFECSVTSSHQTSSFRILPLTGMWPLSYKETSAHSSRPSVPPGETALI
ncbi:MAG: hypothetical protein MZU79_04665 [Anaerotruncus sp.]|nr:hypothetical protein [Anaerotruncus sp.]